MKIKKNERIKSFWEYWSKTHPDFDSHEAENILNEVSYFQKTRTIAEIIRVLKHGGKLIIYENYNNLTPEAYKRLIEDMRKNKAIDFTEDEVEEQRIQPIFDELNRDFLKSEPVLRRGLTMTCPRNEVYTIIKK